ncbi:MAG TPA: 3-dehydroquinate synthase [bacterium]|nr:3-dehydroquinate synthase [bacterium]HQP98162.1 3-dehydroquinate synthase [bacterium]
MREIAVNLQERSYKILVEKGTLQRIGKRAERLGLHSPIAVITDPTVQNLYGDVICAMLRNQGYQFGLFCIPGGEACKNLDTVRVLYDQIIDLGVERQGGIVALGGGLVGDIAGFVAATYLRGIRFVQVPTTLLAQVDASVGGKTGVDHPRGKNLIGAFHQPSLVLIDPSTLKTLPARELLCGLAEIIKHGIIGDPKIFAFVQKNLHELLSVDEETYADLVARNCRFKAKVVEQDEKEAGLRAILNFGHTIGHAIECLTGYTRYLHGEAVAIGMLAETLIGLRMGISSEDLFEEIFAVIRDAGYPLDLPGVSAEQIVEAMRRDKKVLQGTIRMVIPKRLGQIEVREIKEERLILESWKDLQSRLRTTGPPEKNDTLSDDVGATT